MATVVLFSLGSFGASKQMGGITCTRLAFFLIAALGGTAVPQQPSMPPLRPITASDTVLVVAPHPDDESLCCGGLIYTARSVGAHVAIVWITNGDAFKWDAIVVEKKIRPRAGSYLELARQRQAEARKAGGLLDVESDSLMFLGYPDRGVLSLLFDYYHPDTPWRSRFTGANAVVYEDAVDPGASYSGDNLVKDFNSVLDRVKPTLVLAPSPQDTHPDHRGTGLLAWRTMTARGEQERVRYWIVHGGRGWPAPRGYHPNLDQTVAPRGLGMQWSAFSLASEAVEVKRLAVSAHRSQMEVMGRVMLSYVRSDELYSSVPVPPRSRCVHPLVCDQDEEATLMEKSGL
jgi:LmbE family N-acetylglucosaminyl deacetylase